MRTIIIFLFSLLLLTGCASDKPKQTPAPQSAVPKVIITPEIVITGKVVRVDDNAFFVVMNFPVGSLPAIGTRLNVYRQGLKVGVIKVSGPQQEDITVGDISSGVAQVGDEVRAN